MGGLIHTNMAILPMRLMPIDARLLILTQWLSPAFPVGAFAYSHGLEQAIHSGWVSDQESLSDWLKDVLWSGTGRNDAIWIRLAYACDSIDALLDLESEARAFAPSAERLKESTRQGHAFAQIVSSVWKLEIPQSQLPVALGYAARAVDLCVESVCALYLQAMLSNLVSAAQRLMPIGQTAAQAVLAELTADCPNVAQATSEIGIDDLSSIAFLSDIAAMRHEMLQPRIFQT